jgi:hypothetical protein
VPPIFDKFFRGKSAPPSSPKDAFDDLFAQAAAAAPARDLPRALELYDRAIAADASRAEGHYKRANVLKDLGRLAEAAAGYDEAIRCNPGYFQAYCNRGSVQHNLGLWTDALASFDHAIELERGDAFSHYNRALVLQDSNRWEEALESYDTALKLAPTFADAQYNRALCLLFLGRFEPGWTGYEWRWKNAERLGIGLERAFTQPLWLGKESIAERRLLLHAEAGLGDTIQFSRYATLCAARGATVILEVQAPLLDLLAGLEGVSQVVARGGPLPPFDLHCPMMSLPLALSTTVESIPAPHKYLHTDPAWAAHWRRTLGERTRPRIGLCWSGNPNNPIDRRRSIALADWVAHLPAELHYFCLQTEVREADAATLDASEAIFRFDEAGRDFASTAALCECMDLIVTVDTSVAHLAGALGLPTWVLLPEPPDWRWMRGRLDSPWYPTMKLYRQPSPGRWDEVFERISADLRAL